MREIKFRAWDRDLKRMFEVYGWQFSTVYVAGSGGEKWSQLRESITLMEFTGLHDKNGKEIYEGDLMRIDTHDDEVYCVVFWRNMFCAESLWGKEQDDRAHCNWANFSEIGGGDYIPEVIGNIYQHPELLNQSV